MFEKKRLIVALTIAAVALFLGRSVSLDSDVGRLLPDTGGDLDQARVVLRRIMERTVVEVPVEDADRIAELLSPHVKRVRAGASEGDVLELVAHLREHAPRLLDAAAYREIEKRIEPVQVKQTLHTLARRLQEPDGAYLAARAAQDPLGITDLALAPLKAFTAGLAGAKIKDGRLVSADGKMTLLFVEPGFPATDTDRTEKLLGVLDEVRSLGTHRATWDNARQMARDVQLTAAVGLALVVLLALVAFRRLEVALLAILPAVYGAIVALGVYALFSDAIAAAVAGLSAVLLGITIDYAVHVFYSKKIPARAILMGATTTAAAFLALRTSSVPAMREIGTFGAIGVCAAALFAVLVLPARGKRSPLDLSPLVRALRAKPVLFVIAMLTPMVALGAIRVRVSGDVRQLSQLSEKAAADEEEILKRWGDAFRITTLVVRSDTLEGALQKNDALHRRLASYEHASLAGLLPSHRTQDARLARWRTFWSKERIATLRASIAAAIRGTPFRNDAFEAFFDTVHPDAAPPYIERDDLPVDFVKDRILPGPAIATPVFGASYQDFEDTGEWPDLLVVNREAVVSNISRMVGSETLRLGIAALVAVALVASLWLQSILRPLLLLIPLLASCLFTFGLLGWLGVPITMANAIFIVFLFGLAVDYSIFLMEARLRLARTGEDTIAETDSAVLLCAMTTCAGFGVLILAGHPVLHSIGITALVGIVSATIATQILTPLLFAPRTQAGTIRGLYHYQGAIISRYAPSKAKRDPVVGAAPDLCGDASSILVAGCGYGIVTAQLALAGRSVTAVDFDARKLEVAKNALRDFPAVRFEQADLFSAELGQHDCVLCVDLLHYWSADEQATLLKRLVAATEPGGRFLFRDGCAGASGHRWVHFWEAVSRRTGFTRAGSNFHFRTREGWLTLLAECGLEIDAERADLGLGSNLVVLCRRRQ